MTVTRDQAQLLTTLAIACRPYRAPTWDEAGVMAAIAKVHDKSLAEVALAVIRAASDREAQTPGVIAALNGSAWQEQLKPPLFVPTNKRDDEGRCHECGLHELTCRDRQRINGAHEFVSIAAARGRADFDVHRIVADLKERVTTTAPPTNPQPPTTSDPRADVAREALRGANDG